MLLTRLTAQPAHVADFEVRRVLPQVGRRAVGPICFLDHMGPHRAVGREGGGVGPHPHIGLSTVTYLFEGAALHRDSLGTEQRITPGDVNWMTAGRGIVHAERTPPEWWGRELGLHGLQLWVALPAALEECEPSFQHVGSSALPKLEPPGVSLAVVLGEWGAARSPVVTSSPTLFAVATLEAGAQLDVPNHVSERAVYVVSGDVSVDGQAFSRFELGVLPAGAERCITAHSDARVAVLGGEPLEGPRFMWWNFVSSRRERLEQAKADWLHRRFPRIASEGDARVPMPGEE